MCLSAPIRVRRTCHLSSSRCQPVLIHYGSTAVRRVIVVKVCASASLSLPLNQRFIKEWSLRSTHPPIQTPIRSAHSKNLPSRSTEQDPPHTLPQVPSLPPLPSTGRPQLPLSPQEAPLGPPHTRAMTERLVRLTNFISIYNNLNCLRSAHPSRSTSRPQDHRWC